MLNRFTYTYPNIGSFNQRGGLKERYDKLMEINGIFDTDDFNIVEIPADLVKNCKEEKKTVLNVCF